MDEEETVRAIEDDMQELANNVGSLATDVGKIEATVEILQDS